MNREGRIVVEEGLLRHAVKTTTIPAMGSERYNTKPAFWCKNLTSDLGPDLLSSSIAPFLFRRND